MLFGGKSPNTREFLINTSPPFSFKVYPPPSYSWCYHVLAFRNGLLQRRVIFIYNKPVALEEAAENGPPSQRVLEVRLLSLPGSVWTELSVTDSSQDVGMRVEPQFLG